MAAVADAFHEAFAGNGLMWGRHLIQLALDPLPRRRLWLETNKDLTELLVPTRSETLELAHDGSETRLSADRAELLAVSAIRRMALLNEDPEETAA